MSTENQTPTPAAENAVQVEVVSLLGTLLGASKQESTGSKLLPEVIAAWKATEKQKAHDKYVKLLADAIQSYIEAKRAVDAIKADIVHTDAEGKKAGEFFTPAKSKERGEAKQKLAKIAKAIETVLTTGDFSQLNNIKSSGDNKAGVEDK